MKLACDDEEDMDVCSDVGDESTLRLFISVLIRFMITEGGIVHLISD